MKLFLELQHMGCPSSELHRKNTKTRYLHSFHQHFGRKLWSFHFEILFGLGVKVEAPMIWGRLGGSTSNFFGFGTWEHLSRKAHFPGAHAWEMKKMSKTQCFLKQILNSRGALKLKVKKLKNRSHFEKKTLYFTRKK